MTETVNYPDIWYQVKYTFEEDDMRLLFEASQAEEQGKSNDGDITLNGFSLYPEIKGFVKFDGCMEIYSSNICFSGRYMTKQFGELFDKIYDKAKELGLED